VRLWLHRGRVRQKQAVSRVGPPWRMTLLAIVTTASLGGTVAASADPSHVSATSRAQRSAWSVPQPDRGRIAARFGTTYIPRSVPPGYRYVSWSVLPGSAAVYGDFLELVFARRGFVLEWVVGDGRDPQQYGYDACLLHPRLSKVFTPPDQIVYMNRRRVVYQHGNKGATAAICLRGAQPTTAIYIWAEAPALVSHPRAMAQIVSQPVPLS
jgi:hypothetical protein